MDYVWHKEAPGAVFIVEMGKIHMLGHNKEKNIAICAFADKKIKNMK